MKAKLTSIFTALFFVACSGSQSSEPGSEKVQETLEQAASQPGSRPGSPGDIIDVALGAGSFNTLATALTQAGLVGTLKGPGPFTVFAPTDEAFAKLPEGTLESLLEPANKEKLTKILTYHVVQGRVDAQRVMGLSRANTVAGPAIDISVENGKVMLNDSATVVQTDIKAKNGLIHVIDTVILPPE
ncbi:MAG: fasciclin domain-containing protein [Myxococcota bacterium]